MVVHAVVPEARFVSKADVKALAADLAPGRLGRHALPRARTQARRPARRPCDGRGARAPGQTVAIFPEGTTVHRPRPAAVPCQPAAGGDLDRDAGAAGGAALLGPSRRRQRGDGVRRRDHAGARACGIRPAARASVARLVFLPPRASAGVERRELAGRCCAPTSPARSAIDLQPRPRPDAPTAAAAAAATSGVAEVVAADRLERRVELVDQRNAVRDVEADDVGVGRCRRGTSPAPGCCCRAPRPAAARRRGSPAPASRASTAGRARRCPSGIRSAAPARGASCA